MTASERTTVTTDDGVRLDVTLTGPPEGRPVVLVAGFKAAARSWVFQVPVFAEAGYRVVAVDLRGHGTTEPLQPGVTMDLRGRDVGAVLDQLDLRDAVVIGGSMGASTIWARIAQEGTDRIAAVVSADQTPQMLNTSEWPHGFYGYDESNRDTYFAERIPQTGVGTPMWRRGVRLLRLVRAMGGGGGFGISPAELELLNDHAGRDWRPAVASCDVPVLVVAGAESEFWPATHAAATAALAPRGHSTVIERDGHAVNIEQHREFNRRVLGWLFTRGLV
ncbi:alpha/beta hydrolase [Serinibacter arcticus]|uniref:Alpha/beta hydrolase n=1 Tax=Serinibacter arcticus TaxID=1655435 RepID=A0A2U1ZVT3_9MICO|nr:alpha/beta hydrolase [Serinibacter arcticus]PWD51053.1 alpha/beta hydrolase [Serinibacter arcticus]